MLLADIGYGKINTSQVVARLLPEEPNIEAKLAKDDSAFRKIFQKAASTFRERAGVKVNGMEDIVFRFARCCEPLPGDSLVGYVSRGRGVIIHTRGCSQLMSFDRQRLIPVSWDEKAKPIRRIKLTVHSIDQIGILALITQSISSAGANIVTAHIAPSSTGKAEHTFEINIESAVQLDNITKNLEKINGVLNVERRRED
jgi:GTP diphosphokinase / guanosine-3',5'-bis(diphosphate) 3'-diphosphatase